MTCDKCKYFKVLYEPLRSGGDTMRQEDEKCENCKYYHVLKHNFKQYVGFEESHCCTYFRDNLEDNDVDWFIIEVKPDSMCEVFTRKK